MKKWTMKLEQLGPNYDENVMMYGLTNRESKQRLTEIFHAYLSQNRKVGDKLEAWKLYDTPYSFRYIKKVGEQALQFEVCS